MAPPPSNQDAGGEPGRVRCLYCGANNFPASAACWQCGRPLKAAPVGASEVGAPPQAAPLPNFGAAPRPPAARAASETALAPKAAAAMGMLFPYIGLPVGMVFLMLDDPRKTQIGWIMIGWSVLGTVLNSIAFSILLGLLAPLLRGIPHPGGTPGGLPGLPDMGGGAGLWLAPLSLLSSLAACLLPAHV